MNDGKGVVLSLLKARQWITHLSLCDSTMYEPQHLICFVSGEGSGEGRLFGIATRSRKDGLREATYASAYKERTVG